MRYPILPALVVMLSACSPESNVVVRNVLVSPQVDPSLTTPDPKPEREIKELNDVQLYIVDLEEWGDGLNGKIEATGEVLGAFSRKVLKQNCKADPDLDGCETLR